MAAKPFAIPVKPNKANANAAITATIIHSIMTQILKVNNNPLLISMIVPLEKSTA